MNINESIVYVLRKTSLTLNDIGELSPEQFKDLYRELLQQESEERFDRYSFYNVLLSTIHNAPISKPRIMNQNEFYQLREPHKVEKPKNTLKDLAQKKGIKLPKS
jgi:hypothetical protein